MFAELHLPPEIPVDRDDVEDAVLDAFPNASCVGSGSGSFGSNLDFELTEVANLQDAGRTFRQVLRALGVSGARVRFESRSEWINL